MFSFLRTHLVSNRDCCDLDRAYEGYRQREEGRSGQAIEASYATGK